MFYITKIFKLPFGHRLSKLTDSKCIQIHGHNMTIEITVKSKELNKNDMVMNFSNLKDLVNEKIDGWDHGMFLNKYDNCIDTINMVCHLYYTDGDPTAENLCRYLFYELEDVLPKGVQIHSVVIWETDTSRAEYRES